jgi:hypothetical protein
VSILGFDLFGASLWDDPYLLPRGPIYGLTLEQLRAAEDAHRRWVAEWPIRQLEYSMQRRFDRCCHRRKVG